MKHLLIKFFKWIDLMFRPLLDLDRWSSWIFLTLYACLFTCAFAVLCEPYRHGILTLTTCWVIGIAIAVSNGISCYFMYKGFKRGPSKTGRVDAGIWYTAAIALSVVLDITCILWILTIVIVKIIHYPVTGLIKWLSEADIDIEKH